MISIAPGLQLNESELSLDFIRSSGAGGQNVNKVASAVQLRFDILNSPSLPAEVKERLVALCGSRVTDDGVLIIKAQTFRTQEKNRADALRRLLSFVQTAAIPPNPRRATRPPRSAGENRLSTKKIHSQRKAARKVRDDAGWDG